MGGGCKGAVFKHLIGELPCPLSIFGWYWESYHILNFCFPLHWCSLGRGWACNLGVAGLLGEQPGDAGLVGTGARLGFCWGVTWKLMLGTGLLVCLSLNFWSGSLKWILNLKDLAS